MSKCLLILIGNPFPFSAMTKGSADNLVQECEGGGVISTHLGFGELSLQAAKRLRCGPKWKARHFQKSFGLKS
jgi:hypothetical protein